VPVSDYPCDTTALFTPAQGCCCLYPGPSGVQYIVLMLPFLEVEHLPTSSSFYAAIIQPLGLRYLATEDGHFPSVTYGFSSRAAPVFQIRQVVPSRDRPLRISRIVLSAPSTAAADDAYEFALRANPDDRDVCAPRHLAENYVAATGVSARRTDTSGGGTRVLITDFVGNMMEIVFQPPPEYPSQYNGSTVRYTRSTSEEAGRILYWNYDVASSSVSSPAGPSSASDASARTVSRRSHATYPENDDDHSHPGIRRSLTTGSSVYEPAASARENSNGLSAGAVVGTLLGVAAGAAALGGAFSYMTKSDKSRSSRQEYDMPHFSRRSTYPEKHEGYSGKPRYADPERGVDKVRYQNDYPAPPDYRRPPPEYITRYSQADSPRSREADDIYVYEDSRGRAPSSRSRASSARPRSESASYRDPYAGTEAEHRSYASSKSSRHPPIVQRSYTYDTPDRESHVSSRSQRSNSTVRGAPPPDPYAAPAHMTSHSRSGSRVTTTTFKVNGTPRSYSREGSYISARHVPLPDSRAASYISGRDIPLPDSRAASYISGRDIPLPDSRPPSYISGRDVPLHESRAHTYVSGRDVPLPASRTGTFVSARHIPLPASRAGDDWEDDDDTDSIVPGDSISCVGSRGSGRRHY
jgi:hypothetical protein